MTQEDKQLLIKDLCARFPYSVKFSFCDGHGNEVFTLSNLDGILKYDIENECTIRPYLRPMSSMTEKEKQEWERRHEELEAGRIKDWKYADYVDWLNAHHLDYRELIARGLALEAPKDMYKI